MFERLKKAHFSSFMTAMIAAILGLLFVIFPASMIVTITRLVGFVVATAGLLLLIRALTDWNRYMVLVITGIVIMGFGLWIFFYPDPITRFVPIIIGLMLIMHGVDTVRIATAGKKVEMNHWTLGMVSGLLSIVLGVVAIVCSRFFRDTIIVLLGIMLIYDGVSSMIVTGRFTRAERDVVDSTAHSVDDTDDVV